MSGFEFTRNDLIKFKTIEATQINYYRSNDSSVTKTIYQINDLGDIIRSESFTDGKKDHYSIKTYNEQGQILSSQSYSEIFAYDENIGDHVPVWKDGYYNGSDFIYSDGLLIEEQLYNCIEGTRSYNYAYRYYYDIDGIITQEEFLNFYIGITGDFEPNSSVLKSLYYKNITTEYITSYEYRNDSIIETNYGKDDEIIGYDYTILNKNNLPIQNISTDSAGAVITIHRYKYNSSLNLSERTREIVDISKINYDLMAEDRYTIEYRTDGLPSIGRTYYQEELISKRTLTYN
jgi:hypothetical protein